MSRISILNKSEKIQFEQIPRFDEPEQIKYFLEDVKRERDFKNQNTQACYHLILGYFRATGRFYKPQQFILEDIKFLAEKMSLNIDEIKPTKLPASTYSLFKLEILQSQGHLLFNEFESKFYTEAKRLIGTSLKPKQIIYELIGFLRYNRVEVPSYYAFVKCITQTLREFESSLHEKLDNLLTEDQKSELDLILHLPKDPSRDISPSNPYLLTTFKNPEQSVAPRKISESLKDFHQIKDLYNQFSGVLDKLEISDSLINYYALWLTKAKHVTILSISDPTRRFIYLLSFIAYQYRIRQDYFVDTLLKCVNEFTNEIKKKAADNFLNQSPIKLQQTKKIIGIIKSLSEQVESMRNVVFSNTIDDNRKIEEIKSVFQNMEESKEERLRNREKLKEEIHELELSFSSNLRESLIIEGYVSGHRRLMNRTAGIIETLNFNPDTSDKNLIHAVNFFKLKGSKVDYEWPEDHLDKKQTKCLGEIDSIHYSKLYDVFLSIEVADKLNSGSLNLQNSERFRAIEEYLISDEIWANSKEELLEKAELAVDGNFESYIASLKNELFESYKKTNKNVSDNKNISFDHSGRFRIKTPKRQVTTEVREGLLGLLESEELTPLIRVLTEVQETVNYSTAFSHFSLKNFKSEKPADEVFIAGIMALGCNIGLRRMSKVSNGITYDQLNDLIQWYFTKDNVDAASRIINETIDKLSLPSLYRKNSNTHHTSSDGQKFNVSVASLNSSFSYKYFGTGKGVAAYSFIDEFSRLYYNTVIDSSEREASYVIDGLINDGTVTSETHSTDSHGYTEIVFGISNGLGVQFSPRIKNLKQQLIYTFRSHSPKSYLEKGYKITPTANTYINEDLIEKQWDNILRVLVTIKLKVTKASRIIKRLSSYSRQHELHKALKELGRVYKSTFILKYADDVDLRQDTEKALNRVEQSHQFAKAIFFGGNQQLKYGYKEEQELAISCRHLIQNAIVLWNYMTLTRLLLESKTELERYKSIIDTIKSASIMTWRHINIHGEYDFEYHNGNNLFNLDQLIEFDVS